MRFFKPQLWTFSASLNSVFSTESRAAFFHFFFFFPLHFTHFALGQGTINTVAILFIYCSSIVYVFKNIKNGSHDTIHTFKYYFATVFSVFSFNNNKFNPNGPILWASAIVKVALVFLFHMCKRFLFLLFWIASRYFPVQAHGSLHKCSPRENSYKSCWFDSKNKIKKKIGRASCRERV